MRRVPYQHRVLEYAKPNKMIYEVEKRLKKYALEEQVLYPHPQCEAAGQVLPSVIVSRTIRRRCITSFYANRR